MTQETTPTTKKPRLGGSAFAIISELGQLLIIVTLIVIAVLSFGSRVPALSNMGFRFFSVVSGSMEPTIPTGSLIMAGKFDISQLKEGDIITFNKGTEETKTNNSIVTHRVTAISHSERKATTINENGESVETQPVQIYEIKTKGDANKDEDGFTVTPGEILGLYQWHVPQVGYMVNFIQSAKGFIMVVVLPTMVLIIWESVSLILNVREWLANRKKGAKPAAE